MASRVAADSSSKSLFKDESYMAGNLRSLHLVNEMSQDLLCIWDENMAQQQFNLNNVKSFIID